VLGDIVKQFQEKRFAANLEVVLPLEVTLNQTRNYLMNSAQVRTISHYWRPKSIVCIKGEQKEVVVRRRTQTVDKAWKETYPEHLNACFLRRLHDYSIRVWCDQDLAGAEIS
jgi:hypothetical protein